MAATKTAIEQVADERARQIRKGFDAEHDDFHDEGEIVAAAETLLRLQREGEEGMCVDFDDEQEISGEWTLELAAKLRGPEKATRRLIVAAALLIAEIERLDRADRDREK